MDIKDRLPELPVLIVGIVVFVFLIFLLYLQIGVLRSAWQDVSAEQSSLAHVQSVLQDRLAAKQQYEGLRELLNRFDRLVPAQPEENVLLADLERAADEAGADFNQINFDNRVNKSGYVEMPLKLTFTGRYQELLNLVDRLENGPRVMRIDEIKLAKDGQELLGLKADLTASAFYSPR
jgi:type IV pilus assembly protein PilO